MILANAIYSLIINYYYYHHIFLKVRNAQRSGAAGVIIADNTCLCSDVECIEASDNPTCETSEPIMADDGSGSDISIPSFLMFKHDADKGKTYGRSTCST
jgi:hypothetical protein